MKVAIVYSFKPSDWFSCTIINQNLRAAYESVYDDIMYIDYTRNRTVKAEDLQKLADSDVKKVIFIDHQPTPIGFIDHLKKRFPDCFKRLEFTIHVFGDFPLFLPEWRTVFDLLENKPVKFVTASEKQKKFIEKFINQKDSISVCPFPVDSEKFFYDPEKRIQTRADYGVENSFVYLYTGRLTLQKNITSLIKNFCECLKEKKLPAESLLYIVGGVDTLGVPYLGVTQLLGEYYRSIEKALEEFPQERDKVVLWGRVKNEKLSDFYNLADCYVSLSTYHDEDYGMSVAEALCCGLPAVITNWAGYSSFRLDQHSKYCQLVGTEITRGQPVFDQKEFKNKLILAPENKIQRSEMAEIYHNNLGTDACGKILDEIQKKNEILFDGTTGFMRRVTNEQFLRGVEVFKSEATREFNDLYFEAYDVYAE